MSLQVDLRRLKAFKQIDAIEQLAVERICGLTSSWMERILDVAAGIMQKNERVRITGNDITNAILIIKRQDLMACVQKDFPSGNWVSERKERDNLVNFLPV